MAREDYLDRNDTTQPPMCGGAVLDLFRHKSGHKKTSFNQRTAFTSFDQRPLRWNTDSAPSVCSFEYSSDGTIGPNTALLSEHSPARRGSKFFIFNKNTKAIVEFGPHVFDIDKSNLSSPEGSSIQAKSQNTLDSEEKNQFTHHAMPSQKSTSAKEWGQMGKPKRGRDNSCKSKVERITQADVIKKLEMEKKSFEAETLILREEMHNVRTQLEAFQKMLMEQAQLKKGSLPDCEPTLLAVEKKPIVRGSPTEFEREFDFAEWAILEEKSDEATELRTEREEENEHEYSLRWTENYWRQALELGNQESEESDEEDEMVALHDDATEEVDPPPSEQEDGGKEYPDSAQPGPSKDSYSGVPELGVEPRQAGKFTTFEVDDELANDMEFVQKLLKKYQKELGGSVATKSVETDKSQDATERESDDHIRFDQGEAVLQIKNLGDLETPFAQRQNEMMNSKSAVESSKLQEAEDSSLPSPPKVDSVTRRTRNIHRRSVKLRPPVKDTIKKMVPKSESILNPQRSSFMVHDDENSQNRDEHGENTPAQANTGDPTLNKAVVQEVSRTSEVAKHQERIEQQYPSSHHQITDPSSPVTRDLSLRTEQSVLDEIGSRHHTNGSERSERSEADDIDVSTSLHNSFFWSHSISQHSDRTSAQVTKRQFMRLLQEPTYSTDSSDVMDGIELTPRNNGQHTTTPHVLEASQIGQGGVTYTLQVTNAAPEKVPHSGSHQGRRLHTPFATALPNFPSKGIVPIDKSSSNSAPLANRQQMPLATTLPRFPSNGMVPMDKSSSSSAPLGNRQQMPLATALPRFPSKGMVPMDKSSGSSLPMAFRGHAGEYKQIAQRLI